MASLSPSTLSFTSTPSFFQYSFPRTPQFIKTGKRNYRNVVRVISCKEKNYDTSRRDILIGAGGLCGVTTLYDPFAFADPIQPPDLTKCQKAIDVPSGVPPQECCPPISKKIIDFIPPSSDTPMRIRRAAHLVDEAYIEKYCKAVQMMKDLPDDDPLSFKQQANVHCAYCNGAYDQVGPYNPPVLLEVHGSWLFFPFHRYYLYFHEKILGKLINDPTFALPFWNWDSPDGMFLPPVYITKDSPLYDKSRTYDHNPQLVTKDNHKPPVVDLDYSGCNAAEITIEEL